MLLIESLIVNWPKLWRVLTKQFANEVWHVGGTVNAGGLLQTPHCRRLMGFDMVSSRISILLWSLSKRGDRKRTDMKARKRLRTILPRTHTHTQHWRKSFEINVGMQYFRSCTSHLILDPAQSSPWSPIGMKRPLRHIVHREHRLFHQHVCAVDNFQAPLVALTLYHIQRQGKSWNTTP